MPEFYSKGFRNPATNRIYRYVKVHGGRIIESQVYPKETAFLLDANVFSSPKFIEEFEADHLEKYGYSKIDQDAANSLEKQLHSGVDTLSPNEKESWAVFLNSLLGRSPERVKELQRVVENARRTALDSLRVGRERSGDPRVESFMEKLESLAPLTEAMDAAKAQYFNHIVGDQFIRSLMMAPLWINTTITSSEFLITSDYPVLLIRAENSEKILGLKIALTPKILQSIYFPSDASLDFHKSNVGDFIKYHNLMQIKERPNFVYSDRPLDNSTNIQYTKAMELSMEISDPKNPS